MMNFWKKILLGSALTLGAAASRGVGQGARECARHGLAAARRENLR